MVSRHHSSPNTLAIGLGANLPSALGAPVSTLIAVRPKLEKTICEWVKLFSKKSPSLELIHTNLLWRWSPLFETKPIGGPENQPNFINAVLIINGSVFSEIIPSELAAINLLNKLLKIEKAFGRDRTNTIIPWGPRTLDLDLLAWGALHVSNSELILPHPRLIERSFVLVPLMAALKESKNELKQIPPQPGWEEE